MTKYQGYNLDELAQSNPTFGQVWEIIFNAWVKLYQLELILNWTHTKV